MVAHSSFTATADLHVCKGAATASAGQIAVFNGASGQSNMYTNPHGLVYFVNYAAPNTITYPSTYTKINPVTVAGGVAKEFTEGTNAILTYTGTIATKARIIANVTLDQSVGANRDIGLKIYKNGSAIAGSEIFTTSPSGLKQLITSIFDVSLVTNDYLEAYVINLGASGDVNIYAYTLTVLGVRG